MVWVMVEIIFDEILLLGLERSYIILHDITTRDSS